MSKSNILSELGAGLSSGLGMIGGGLADAAGIAGRGVAALGSLGMTEMLRMAQEKEQLELAAQNAKIAEIIAKAQPNNVTPQQFDAQRASELYRVGSPGAVELARSLVETPELRLNRDNTMSAIQSRADSTGIQREQLGLQRQELDINKADKERNYQLAARELEHALKGGIGSKEVFDREANLRKEYVGQSKDFISQRDAYDRIKASAENPSAAGDIALIYNFMKVQDPGSTVREGEFATAQNAGGVPEVIRSQWNKLQNGERLSSSIRKDFLDRSNRLYKSASRQHDKRTVQYKSLAERAGVNPEQVTVDLGLAETPKEPKTTPSMIKFLGFE